MPVRKNKKENESLEFKKSLAELKEGLISIAAILNKHGAGEIWFGIKNDGIATGLDITEKTLRDISQTIAAHIEPKIYPQIKIERYQGKACLRVIFQGKEVPYFAYGRAYMRVADEDRQLTVKSLENLIFSKNRDYLHWDSEVSAMTPKDVDKERLKNFITRAGLKWSSVPNVMEKLNLLKKGHLRNAASLFFAKAPRLQLRCAVFGGTSTASIVDRHDFEGDILSLIEEAQKYILKNIHIGMRLNGLYREDLPEISIEAIRETIINAFCHRDYRDPDYVQIAIFKNRIEIRSPGGLIDGLTIKKIRRGNISRRRNPLIADLLRRIQMVEAWGRGMALILEKEPKATFQEVGSLFITHFSRPSFYQQETQATQKTSEKASEKTSEKIIVAISQNSELTIADLATLIGVTKRSIERNLQKLQAQGKLRRVGPDKGGRWEVL